MLVEKDQKLLEKSIYARAASGARCERREDHDMFEEVVVVAD